MSDERFRMSGAAHVERVRLTWWEANSNRRQIHWAANAPVLHSITIEVLGVLDQKKISYNVHGVLPQHRLPMMTDSEKNMMLMVLRDALAAQMSRDTLVAVAPIKRDLVEWKTASLQESKAILNGT
jgi:hypothetical protein